MVYDTFTAANTAKGFFSYFNELLYSEDVKKAYLIKGGPGCGKSTFMKKISDIFDKKGFTVERIRCSSDKDSLDGIKIFEKGIVIIDATSPHAFDMKYPGAYDNIIDLSKFWNTEKLSEKFDDIKSISDEISLKYRYVYSLLKIIGGIEVQKYFLFEPYIDLEKVNCIIKKIIKQNALLPKNSSAKIHNRMLSAFTKDGIYTISETTDKLCENIVLIEDNPGIANIILLKAANIFTKMGYDTIRIHSPLLPESRLEQIIIPDLKLGLITTGHLFSPDVDENKISKKITTKSILNKHVYAENKNKLNFNKKLSKELLLSVYDELKTIKQKHDDLEKYYIDAIDFSKTDNYLKEFINEI